MTTTPALSLWQPYASLIAIGVKPYETRDWPPPARLIGQRIAIHAAKRMEDDLDLNTDRAIQDAFGRSLWWSDLPRGAVVCTAVLAGAFRCGLEIDEHQVGVAEARTLPGQPAPQALRTDLFGNYDPGRWCWHFVDVEPLDPPVPAKGMQGIWRWTPPAVAA